MLEKDEDKKNTTILIRDCFQKISGITEKRNNKFLEFFNEVKDALAMDFKENIKECMDYITTIVRNSQKQSLKSGLNKQEN